MPSYSFGLSGVVAPSQIPGAVSNLSALGGNAPVLRDLALSNVAGSHDTSNWGVVSGADAIRQQLEIRFAFFLAEWVLNTALGIPFFEKIFVKNPNREEIRKIFTSEALKEPGVAAVESFSFVLNSQRKATITMTVRVNTGELIALNLPVER